MKWAGGGLPTAPAPGYSGRVREESGIERGLSEAANFIPAPVRGLGIIDTQALRGFANGSDFGYRSWTKHPEAIKAVVSEARMGEMLERIPDKKATSGGGSRSLPSGIDHKASHYAQQLAKHPPLHPASGSAMLLLRRLVNAL